MGIGKQTVFVLSEELKETWALAIKSMLARLAAFSGRCEAL
jgi:hypothetical protein